MYNVHYLIKRNSAQKLLISFEHQLNEYKCSTNLCVRPANKMHDLYKQAGTTASRIFPEILVHSRALTPTAHHLSWLHTARNRLCHSVSETSLVTAPSQISSPPVSTAGGSLVKRAVLQLDRSAFFTARLKSASLSAGGRH